MMSANLILLTLDAIDDADFAAFLTAFGGVSHPGEVETGQVSRGRCHLWIFLSPQTLAEILEVLADALVAKLGRLPLSCVVLELSRAQGTERLALEFSIAVAERWNAVPCDPKERLLTLDDMRRALRDGESLGVSA
jgi:hypothetical protein